MPPAPACVQRVSRRGTSMIDSRQYHASILALCVATLGISWALEVRSDGRVRAGALGTLPEVCQWRRLLGIDCPGCGLTRSFICLSRAQWARAWNFNPAGIALFGAVVLQVPFRVWQLARLARGFRAVVLPGATVSLVLLPVLLAVQWVARLAW